MNKNILIGILVVAVLGGIVVYAVNKSNDGTPSDTASSTTPVNNDTTPPATRTPAAPVATTDTIVTPSASTAVVTGKVYPNGAQTSYWFEYGTTPEAGSRTQAQVIGSSYVNIPTPAYITGLNSNTKYYFRLVAENAYGKVMATQYAFQTTLAAPPAQGNAPTTRTTAATSVERTTANLNGTVNANGSQTTYWFEYGTSADLGSVTAFQSISGSGTQNISISLSNLLPQTRYHFRINAQNQFGTVNGAIMTFTTKGPAATAKPTVSTDAPTAITTSEAQFNGRINPNGLQTSYWFEYGTDSLLGSLIGTSTATTPIPAGTSSVDVSTDISGLSSNTRYYVRLVGQNSQGTVKGDIENFRTK